MNGFLSTISSELNLFEVLFRCLVSDICSPSQHKGNIITHHLD